MLGAAIVLIAILVVVLYPLAAVMWARMSTTGDAYFGLPIAERRALKARIGRHARVVAPLLEVVVPLVRSRLFLMKKYRGFTAPAVACTPETFAFAHGYAPQPEDVFIATQMKCGTTWMQQIVYEAVCRGAGNLGDDGHRHMYATSPWIESQASVSLADAPLVGEKPTRIIKTHFSAALCPYDPAARYIYVLRHPVSCFASCVDFVRAGLGPIAPDREGLLDWFCSEDMWWGPWPDHAEGWWQWRERENVLFVHYEEMKKDLGAAVRQVSNFLSLSLDKSEIASVTEKSGYSWMKDREEWFEMHPPNFFSTRGAFFNSGARDRYKDASDKEAERIRDFCRKRLAGASYPLARFYPDVAGG